MSFATGLGVASAGLSIFGTLQQGRQEQQLHEFNATVAQQKAQLAEISGGINKTRLRRQQRKFESAQTAGFAAAGVRASGTPMQVKADSLAQFEFDIMIEDFNTRVAVLNATSEAELSRLRGSQARTASFINAGSTLLSASSSFIKSGNKGNIKTASDPFANSTIKEIAAGQSLIIR